MMNRLITFLMLFILAAASPPETFAQESRKNRKDSLCIVASGAANQVIINSKKVTRVNGCIDSLAVKGEIVQNGENNKVAIQIPKHKTQNTDKYQKPTTKTQTKPETRNLKPATIKIKQSGKNNTVKINSR